MISEVPEDQKVGTLTFAHSDGAYGTHIKSQPDSTYDHGGSHDVPLGEYLGRPVLIYSNEILDSNQLTEDINPWLKFFQDTEVQKRVDGFRHIRGKLRIRAMVTGNPMSYGRYLLAYEPRANDSMHVFASRFSDAYYMQATALPHVFLDIAKSEGAEMTLPFFCPDNWIDLTDPDDVPDMGLLHLDTVSPLTTANGTAGTASVRIFAWMEDVELCTPTTSILGTWTAQSLEVRNAVGYTAVSIIGLLLGWLVKHFGFDATFVSACSSKPEILEEQPQNEFSKSPVSQTASAVAKAASIVGDIPALAPYAKATEMGATALGSIAHLFGFSRPQVLDNPVRYREYMGGELATTNTHENVARLSLDVKGELTVDSRTVGLDGVDEMTVEHICSKEVIITRFNWTTSEISGEILETINITPMHFKTDTTPPVNNRSAVTPACAVGMLFKAWRGTCIVRLSFVASTLHRGKVRVIYDPVATTADTGYNQAYSRIVDLGVTRDVELEIGWHASNPYLFTEFPQIGTTNYQVGPTVASLPEYTNGQLRIEVLNPLNSPNPDFGTSIEVIASMRWKDIQFADPTGIFMSTGITYKSSDVTEEPQSTDFEKDDGNMPETADPIEPIGDNPLPKIDQTDLVFYGEVCPSMRTFLRRYRLIQSRNPPVTAKFSRFRASANFLDIHEFVISWYAGWRGSLRHKFIDQSPRSDSTILSFGRDGAGLTASGSCAGAFINLGTAEVEVPFYFNKRFAKARAHPTFTSYRSNELGDPNNANYGLTSFGTAEVSQLSAVGEDFSTFFYVGPPLLYNN